MIDKNKLEEIYKTIEYGIFLDYVVGMVDVSFKFKNEDFINKLTELITLFSESTKDEALQDFNQIKENVINEKIQKISKELSSNFSKEEIQEVMTGLIELVKSKSPTDMPSVK